MENSVLLFSFWGLLLTSINVGAIEVVVATGVNDDPPYVYGDDKIVQENPGVTIDILKLIEARSDVTFTILKQPWKRVVSNIKSNEIDGGFHFSYKEKRKAFVAYPILKGESASSAQYSISKRSYYLYA
ncbi:MAG: transporter substrate-binding domain-containing protein [Bermanella sp.]